MTGKAGDIMINKNRRNCDVTAQGTGTTNPVYKWAGKWYKPWTWFRYSISYYVIIDDFNLVAFSLVENHTNLNCVINHEEQVPWAPADKMMDAFPGTIKKVNNI